MLFMARKAPPSPARAALAAGMVTACALLALLGVVALATGRAGSGIALPVALAVAVVFIGGRS